VRARSGARDTASAVHSLRFLLGLSWLLVLAAISFVGTPKRRPPEEPQTWKLVVWLLLLLVSFPGCWIAALCIRALVRGG